MPQNRYLSEFEIDLMADAALRAYEFACDWQRARCAAWDYCVEEFSVVPRKSAVLLAVKRAQLMWEGERIRAGVFADA